MSASSITRLGMVGCAVLDQTVRAVMDIPGVLATSLKAGACGFGEAASVRKTWWQPEQTCCAYANPFPASPTSAIRVTAGVLVLLVGHLSPVFIAIRHNAVGLDFRESQAQLLLVECSDAAHKWLAERETRMLRMGAAKRWSVFGVAVARYTNRAGRAALLYASFGAGEQRFGHALAR